MSQASVEIENILRKYQIGDLVYYKQDERGYCNTNFAIETELLGRRQRYFFRRYKSAIKKEELLFEHSIIKHLNECSFNLVPKLIKTIDGNTYVQRFDLLDGGNQVFYAIFEFLDGDDRYTWLNPQCTSEEIVNAATVLARFHDAVFGLIPEGRRYQPKINDLLPIVYSSAIKCLQKGRGTVFDDYLEDVINIIHRSVMQTQDGLSLLVCQDLVQLVNHGDYHPGNLKFQGEQVVALLDFDWSKIEVRCFDVALAIYYFFTDWEVDRDGQLRLDQTALFLNSYQNSLIDSPGLGPLDEGELKCLPAMLAASNLYVMNWTLSDYFDNLVDPDEYLVYLAHGINFIKWFEVPAKREKLEFVCASAPD